MKHWRAFQNHSFSISLWERSLFFIRIQCSWPLRIDQRGSETGSRAELDRSEPGSIVYGQCVGQRDPESWELRAVRDCSQSSFQPYSFFPGALISFHNCYLCLKSIYIFILHLSWALSPSEFHPRDHFFCFTTLAFFFMALVFSQLFFLHLCLFLYPLKF